MYNLAILRKLGNSKVLVVEADSAKAQRRVEALMSGGASVEVVAYEFQVLTRLGKPNHDYNFVFLGNKLFSPDGIREVLLEQDLFR